MKIKVGDNVKVIAGADKGKTGKVIKTLKRDNRVIVEGVHVVKRHMKPNRMNETGGIIEIERSIDASNVKLVSDSPKKETAKKETKTVKAATTTKKKSTKESEK